METGKVGLVLSLDDLTKDYNKRDERSKENSPGSVRLHSRLMGSGSLLTSEHKTENTMCYLVPGGSYSLDDAAESHVQPQYILG